MTNQHAGLHLAFSDNNNEVSNLKKEYEYAALEVKPGVRFFARAIDMYFFSFLFAFILIYYIPAFDFNEIVFSVISLFAWIFIEPFFLISWGTTPGKWLLHTTIRTTDKEKLSLGQAFKRSFRVWFFGLGLGIPFVMFFTLFFPYLELNKNKKTIWDKSGDLVVTHQKIPLIKIVLAVIIIGTPIAINFYELYSTRSHYPHQDPIKYRGLSANYY